MEDKRATGRDVIEAVVDNMTQSLEPLYTKTLAPSLFQVYLHPNDHQRLMTIEGELAVEASLRLDRALSELNAGRDESPLEKVAKLGAFNKLLQGDPETEAMTYERAGPRWDIRIDPHPDESFPKGGIEVASQLAIKASSTYAKGSDTVRISRTQRIGETSKRDTKTLDVLARIAFTDDSGSHEYAMTKDEILIGRRADVWADLQVVCPVDVSRKHVRIRRVPAENGFEILDVSSLGTSVNGEKIPAKDLVQWTRLPERARIGLAGKVVLEFESRIS